MKKKGKILALVLASVMSTSIVVGSGLVLTGCQDKENPPATQGDQLATPATLSYANGKLTWSAVTHATSYEVTVTKADSVALKQTVNTTELSVSSLESGDYTASVVAKADGYTASTAKTANFTVAAALQALPTPTGFAYAADKITWTAVTGATAGYLVKVVKKSDNSVAIAEKTVTAAELDVSALTAGEYTLSVTAKAVEGKNLASLAAAYSFTVAEETATLATPAGGAVDAVNRKVTWNAVDNAEEYEVTVKVGGSVEAQETVTKPEFDISSLEDTTFSITIVAKAEGYNQSEAYTYNGSITAIALTKVTELQADSAKTVLSWKHEEGGADHYRVIVKNGQTTALDKEVIANPDASVYKVDIVELGAGEYTVEVYAVADEFDIFRSDSDAATLPIVVDSLGAYEAVSGIRVDGANLVWNENNAIGYEIVVTEKGASQALDIHGAKADGESFNFLKTGLPAGDYTVSVTPKDNRHTGEGVATTYDVALKNVKSFNAEAIAAFDGDTSRGGEHGKAELIDKNGTKVAKVMPTVDGWGRVRSEAFMIDYSNNPIVVVDIDEVVIGGYHLQVNVGGTNYAVIRDSMIVDDTIAKFIPEIESSVGQSAGITGSQESYLRLGVDHSTDNALNNAETHFNSLSVWYLNEWQEAITGNLAEVADYHVSNGMDVAWGAVENADSYRVTLVKKGATEAENVTIAENEVQTGVSYRTRDLAAGEYVISVSAFNSENAGLVESAKSSYTFRVNYLKEYTAQDIQAFNYIDGDSRRVDYDEAREAAIIDPEGAGWGVMAPDAGVEVNLTNKPFAYVDVVAIEGGDNAGYISRARYTPQGSDSELSIVLRNDTVTKSTDDWYVELWKRADGNHDEIFGKASYRFGVGFINGSKIYVKAIRIVEITEVSELDPDAHTPLAAPSDAKEVGGVLSASTVPGNSEYTPTYAVTVTEKGEGGQTIYTGTELSAPSVNLAALGLTSGKTYTVSFKALGDNGYFVDSAEYVVELDYTEIYSLTDFTGVTLTTRTGGEATGIVFDDTTKKLSVSVPNGAWGYAFLQLDLTSVLDALNADKGNIYYQWKFDVEASSTGVNAATRFIYNGNDVGTGHGDSPLGSGYFLTKEWSDKIVEGKLDFAFGMGGGNAGEGATKTVVLDSLKFVKFTIRNIAG